MKVELHELAELNESLDSRLLPSLPFSVSFGMYPSKGPAKLTGANLVPRLHMERLIIKKRHNNRMPQRTLR